MDSKEFSNTNLTFNTKSDIYNSSIGLGSNGYFHWIISWNSFLISCAAILALKELSESNDNKIKFTILRKIGASDMMINKALFKQIGVFFLLPLVLAIIHSIFGIIFL